MKKSTRNRPTKEERQFRDAIWARDRSISRATGNDLSRSTPVESLWHGDVCHLKPKGRYPELKYATANAFLMERFLHIASDGRGGYRLKISGDANGILTFVMRDKTGQVLWERTSSPP